MREKVFVDSDIVYDLLARREPFYAYAASLFTLAEQGKIEVCISALTMANVHYLLSRQLSASEARSILSRFRLLVTVLPLDEKCIDLALNADFRDFEDAIQHFTALIHKVPVIITRNLKDYKSSLLPVMSAEEFVKGIH